MQLAKLSPFRLAFSRLTGSATSGAPPPTTTKPLPTPVQANEATEDPTKYNVPEYYQHTPYSYYDLDSSMFKYRIGQPSKYDPLVPKK